jgi:hypothetical protein
MTPTSQSLVFTATPLSLAVSIGFVLAMVVLAVMAWRRSARKGWTAVLEALRVVIALLIAITLNQPEWREIYEPDFKPTLAVLTDVSRSMDTKDVLDPKQPMAEPKSRADAAKPLSQPGAWETLKGRLDVVQETFSSRETPPEEGTDLNGALDSLMQKHARLGGVVLATDGDWNTGSAPSQAATRLRMRGVPVFAVPIGAETRLPDVELVAFDVPAFGVAGKPLRIPFAIESSLPRDETATLSMKVSTGEIITKDVVIPAMGRLQDSIVWKPDKPGDAKLTLTIPQVGDERYPENNALDAALSIRKEQLHVLVIESVPRWEYRYLRNALERDPGVEVNTLLYLPGLEKPGAGRGYLSAFPKDEALTAYDVIFIGDVGMQDKQLTDVQCTAIQKLVRDQAAGLVFLPGLRGNEASLTHSPLGELMPVVLDEAQPGGWGSPAPGKFVLTEAGTRSLLTKLEDTDEASARVWSTLPGFQWYAPALRAKAGTEVLATHGSESTQFGRVPLIVTKTYGAGKILFMGTDGAWRWRRGVEDKYHYRFWGQVVRWMAYQRNMAKGDKMRLFYSPDRPKTGGVLTLNANVMTSTGEPLRDGNVVVQIVSPSGKPSSIRLTAAGEEAWGLFSGTFTPLEPGEHRVTLSSAESGSTLETTIAVQGTSREKRGQPARYDVLREIAQLTRGQFLATADPAAVVAAVAKLPAPEPLERRLPLWAHPVWAGVIVLLLGIFWVGRKAAGAF